MLPPSSPAVLANHIGYAEKGSAAVLITAPEPFTLDQLSLIGSDGTSTALSAEPWHQVPGWSTGWYARCELPRHRESGTFRVRAEGSAGVIDSRPFVVGPDRIQQQTISDVLAYFRASRSFGEIDRKDRHARFYQDDSGAEVDAHGGWLDASGDFSKFLSHLTYTRMMSPQQIPLCAWSFAAARDELASSHPDMARHVGARLRDEALFGADFLLRFQAPEGYFYTAIFDALTKNLDERVINAPLQNSVRTQRWQAAYRHGGGLAIAALARASTFEVDGDEGTRAQYLAAAVKGFLHLEQHNKSYSFDGTESVIDDYCALLAAAELSRALGTDPEHTEHLDLRESVLKAGQHRADSLAQRWRLDPEGIGYLVGDESGRPFFHAAESGLPVISLLRWAELVPEAAKAAEARKLARDLMLATVARVDGVVNPFGYLRQYSKALSSAAANSFFYPHENETGYWWQGENANISSVAYAATLVSRLPDVTEPQCARLERLSADLLHWVTGLNPFDTSMLQGRGFNNAEYSTAFQNIPGGILNGITAGFDDESDIAFLPEGPAQQGDSWRWAEQWIPHSAWYLLAVSTAP